MNYSDKQFINYAVYIRVIGTILILLCHFVQQNINVYMQMTAQFFSIGVSIFFILSGFLFGVSPYEIRESNKWYLKRIKRIYIPYEIFVVTLALIYVFQGRNIFTKNWLLLILGAQGTDVGVLGAEQTWFISSLLICYLCTPVISKCLEQKKTIKIIIETTIIGIPVLLSLLRPDWIFTLFTPVVEYFIAFWIGKNISKIKLSLKYIPYVTIVLLVSFGIRIGARALWDGSILYDRVIVFYTQMIGGFCICYIIGSLFKNMKVYNLVYQFSSISYEVYLFHYMFTVGPVSLFGQMPNWIMDCILVTMVTILISILAHILSVKISVIFKKIP